MQKGLFRTAWVINLEILPFCIKVLKRSCSNHEEMHWSTDPEMKSNNLVKRSKKKRFTRLMDREELQTHKTCLRRFGAKLKGVCNFSNIQWDDIIQTVHESAIKYNDNVTDSCRPLKIPRRRKNRLYFPSGLWQSKFYNVIPENPRKCVSTNRGPLQCKTLAAHFSVNTLVDYLLKFV